MGASELLKFPPMDIPQNELLARGFQLWSPRQLPARINGGGYSGEEPQNEDAHKHALTTSRFRREAFLVVISDSIDECQLGISARILGKVLLKQKNSFAPVDR